MNNLNNYLEKTLYQLMDHFENEIVESKEAKTSFSFKWILKND